MAPRTALSEPRQGPQRPRVIPRVPGSALESPPLQGTPTGRPPKTRGHPGAQRGAGGRRTTGRSPVHRGRRHPSCLDVGRPFSDRPAGWVPTPRPGLTDDRLPSGRGSTGLSALAYGDSVRTPVDRSVRRTLDGQAPDQHFQVVETVGLEPTAFCLQSRDRSRPDQRFCASAQVRAHFSITM